MRASDKRVSEREVRKKRTYRETETEREKVNMFRKRFYRERDKERE